PGRIDPSGKRLLQPGNRIRLIWRQEFEYRGVALLLPALQRERRSALPREQAEAHDAALEAQRPGKALPEIQRSPCNRAAASDDGGARARTVALGNDGLTHRAGTPYLVAAEHHG